MKRIKWNEPEFIKPLDTLLSAEITGPDKLVLQKEEQSLPNPFTPQFRNPTNSFRSLRSKPPRMRFLLFKLTFCHILTDMSA